MNSRRWVFLLLSPAYMFTVFLFWETGNRTDNPGTNLLTFVFLFVYLYLMLGKD